MHELPQMEIFKDFVSLVFPDYCLMCNRGLARQEECVCLHCRYNLPLANYHLYNDNPLSRRFAGRAEVRYAWAYLKFLKGGRVQNALHHLKYNAKPQVGRVLGGWFGAELKKHGLHNEVDLIAPVPLHPTKLKKRGYNQCDPIADGLAAQLQVEWQPHLLRRIRANRTQTRLNRMARHENTQQIFDVPQPVQVQNRRILLVDDVVTTGATLDACISVLLEAGCREVSIACLAAAQ